MNNVSLVGRPTKDPELKFTPAGVPMCSFTLAVDREYKNREGKREADFIFVRVWNKQAEYVADYVTKGRLISVTGRIATNNTHGTDGSVRYWTEVVAESIGFLGPKKAEETGKEEPDDEVIPDSSGFTPVWDKVDNPFDKK